MSKYLLTISKFNDWREGFFNNYTSIRNKEFASHQGYEYLEIKDVSPYRNSGTWLKLKKVKELIDSGFLKENDDITVIDADICIVDGRHSLTSEKPFTYAVDSCNTHCMGYYSIKVCHWSIGLINNLLNDDNFRVNGYNDFWQMWAEQASFYYLTGVQRHSDIPFFDLPNYGYGVDKRIETIYEPKELLENIEVRGVEYNTTYVLSDIDYRMPLIEQYYINKSDYDKIILRHWAGGQQWNEKYFGIPLKK